MCQCFILWIVQLNVKADHAVPTVGIRWWLGSTVGGDHLHPTSVYRFTSHFRNGGCEILGAGLTTADREPGCHRTPRREPGCVLHAGRVTAGNDEKRCRVIFQTQHPVLGSPWNPVIPTTTRTLVLSYCPQKLFCSKPQVSGKRSHLSIQWM